MRSLDEELVGKAIRERMQQEDLGRLAIASSATCLLVVGLERSRHGVVHDDPHVRLVDAHAEGVRRDDGADVAVHEGRLHVVAVCVVEPRVIRECRDASLLERDGDLLDIAAGGGVHDGDALVFAQHADERLILVRV